LTEKNESYEDLDDADLKFNLCKNKMQELVEKFEDLTKLDKIYEANANIEDVKLQVEDNVKQMIKRNVDLD